MARQSGDIKVCGTIHGVTFYTMKGEYYARAKSSLDRQRFMRDPAFEGSRRSAQLLAQASVLASRFYRQLPMAERSRQVYHRMTGRVKLLLKDGWNEEQVAEMLEQEIKKSG